MSRVGGSLGLAGKVGLALLLATALWPAVSGRGQTPLPTIALSFTDATPSAITGVSEGGGAQAVRVVATASAATSAQVDVAVTVGVAGGSAVMGGGGSDFSSSASSVTVSIASGDTSGSSGDITVTPVSDSRVEGDETIRFTAASVSGYQAIADADLTLTDDDDSLTLSLSRTAVMENASAQGITVTATFAGTTSDLTGNTDVTVTVAGGQGADGAQLASDPSAPGAGDDFWTNLTGNQLTVSVPATSVSGTGTFDLTARADGVDETAQPEKVAVSGAASVGDKTLTVAAAEVTIHDAVITLGLVDGSGDEVTAVGEDDGEQTMRITATVPAPPPAALPVAVTVGGSGSTADEGANDDYTTDPSSPVTVTIADGDTTATSADISVTPRPDLVTEDHETIEFTADVTGYTVESAELEITDADRTIVVTSSEVVMTEQGDPAHPTPNDGICQLDCDVDKPWAAALNTTITAFLKGVTSSTYTGTALTGVHVLPQDVTTSNDWFYYDDNVGRSTITIPQGELYDEERVLIFSKVDRTAEVDATMRIGLKAIDGFTVEPATIVTDVDDDVQIRIETDSTGIREDSTQSHDVTVTVAMKHFRSRPFGGSQIASQLTLPISVTAVSVSEPEEPPAGVAGDAEFNFASVGSTLSIAAGELASCPDPAVPASCGSVTLAGLRMVDDDVVEGPEHIRLTGAPSSPGVTFQEAGGAVKVIDDDADITLSVLPSSMTERNDPHEVTVRAEFAGSSSILTSDTIVTVTVAGGTATLGSAGDPAATPPVAASGDFWTDLTSNMLTVRIPAGRLSGTAAFDLTARNDGDAEAGGETVSISGAASVGGDAVTVTGADLTILDGGAAAISLSLTDTAAMPSTITALDEDGGATTVRIKAEVPSPTSSDVDVTVAIGGGTASADDYTAPETATITISNGQRSGYTDITITPASDTVTEAHETFLFNGSAAGYVGGTAALTITDADRDVTIVVDNLRVGEVGDNACQQTWNKVDGGYPFGRNIRVVLEGETNTYPHHIGQFHHSNWRDRVRLTVENGTATRGADFWDILTSGQAFQWAHTPFLQGRTSASFGQVGGSSSFWGRTATCGDDIAEGDETFSYSLQGVPAGFNLVKATMTLVDDDSQVQLTAPAVAEGSAVGALSITAAFPATTSVISTDTVVTVSGVAAGTANSGAADGDDFSFTQPGTSPTVTIKSTKVTSDEATNTGNRMASLTGLAITDDDVVEGPETLILEGTSTLGDARGELTVNDNDADITLSVFPASVREGSAEEITVTARFAGSSSVLTTNTDVTVTIASGDGTGGATLGSSGDFTTDAASDQVTVTIPAGELSGSATFNLTAATDSDNEDSEPGKLTGAATVGTQTVTVTGTTINIVDADLSVGLTIDTDTGTSGDQTSLDESASGSQTVRVTAALGSGNAPTGGLTIGLNAVGVGAVVDDGATFEAGEDIRITYPSTPAPPSNHGMAITIPQGDSSASADITVVLNDDGTVEATETVRIQGADVTVGSDTYQIVGSAFTITDDDTAPSSVSLTLQTADGSDLETVGEGETVRVRVLAEFNDSHTLERRVMVPLTVGRATDTSVAGTDFEEVTGLAVTIEPNQPSGSAEFDLTTTEDTDPEGAETVTVHGGTLSAALTGLGITAVTVDELTITDDEISIVLEDSEGNVLGTVREGAASEITVRASYPEGKRTVVPRAVRVTVREGTASAGEDFRAVGSRDILIPFRQTSGSAPITFDLDGTFDDDLVEGDETLQIVAEADGFDIAPIELTVSDDDNVTGINLSVSPASVRESPSRNQTFTLTAALVGGVLFDPVTVNAVIQGGAASGNGYNSLTPTSLTIEIPARAAQAQASFSARILDDSTSGNTKTLRVTGTATGYTVNPATFRITDDGDSPPAPPPTTSPPPSTSPPPPSGGGGGGGAPPPAGGGAPPPAQPAEPAEPAFQGRFSDEDGSVHQANIERIAEWQITLGCSATDPALFCPRAQITRRQMAAFLYRAVSQRWEIEAPTGIEINDVPADAWYRTFADWVVSVEAFALDGEGNFNPGGVVTRADMAIMLIAAFPHLDAVDDPPGRFQDAQDVPPAVAEALEGMFQTGVTRGCSTEPLRYCPDQPVTRAQMASFFVRAIDLAPETTAGS